ncbi:hypothetical protein PANT111_180044 [Pantoea brenneri]|uniref:Uncharacterized protein n=1 Tax=Pantoea brenneri TaxID=472694 RepID=A0AAX3J5V3_9GAMM|nr:hypothetical protein PANT111_180044 [Pantoea brenneri]
MNNMFPMFEINSLISKQPFSPE